MTTRGPCGGPSTSEPREDGTTAEWFPAADERMRVTRPMSRSLAEVERALRVRPDEIVRLAYGAARTHDAGADATLSPFRSQRWVHVSVRVEFRSPPPAHSGAVISLTWHANRRSKYFPVLTGDIFLHPRNGGTLIELDGAYRPPLGLAGLVFDRVLGRRIATAAAVGFVSALGAALDGQDGPLGADAS